MVHVTFIFRLQYKQGLTDLEPCIPNMDSNPSKHNPFFIILGAHNAGV